MLDKSMGLCMFVLLVAWFLFFHCDAIKAQETDVHKRPSTLALHAQRGKKQGK